MIAEEDLLPLSALQHFLFCKRRAGLVHLERIWEENLFTAEGAVLHQKVHESDLIETRGNVRLTRGLSVKSLKLGLSGKLDLVEFHRVTEEPPLHSKSESAESDDVMDWLSTLEEESKDALGHDSVDEYPALSEAPTATGIWRPYPVEYKRGRIRREESFEVQLCAQAICLEEMLGIVVPEGAIFYGGERRRVRVEFSDSLRHLTEESALKIHEMVVSGVTPPPEYGRKCRSCSLQEACMPQPCSGKVAVSWYMAHILEEM